MKEEKKMKVSNQLNYKPFLGRLLIEAIEDDVEAYLKEEYGISKDSKLALPESYTDKYKCPVIKGKILEKSVHSFGEAFEKRYGKDMAEEGRALKPGDIVWFVHNQAYSLDRHNKYLQLNDEQILGYTKVI